MANNFILNGKINENGTKMKHDDYFLITKLLDKVQPTIL